VKRSPRFPPVGFLLTRLGRTQSGRFAKGLEPLELRPASFAVLNFAALAEGSSQQQLGERLAIDPSGLVALIDELEGQGLVERRRDPADRRRHAVHPTEGGRRTLTKARAVAREAEAELLAPLSDEEAEQFRDLLLKLVGLSGIPPPG
jgi:DNA-binding MarR family transcriptional regulator